MRRVAALLLHHPVLDRQAKVVTTAVTNLDLHDIARSARTYGLVAFYVAHPVAAQRELCERVRAHWTTGSGAQRIPDRRLALETLHVVDSLDAAIAAFARDAEVELWVTSASAQSPCLGYADARQRIAGRGADVLIVFGTGWGLAAEVHARAAAQLEPIRSPAADAYNHLSVRAAAAITFDRLMAPPAGP